jgi:hypothetical protein
MDVRLGVEALLQRCCGARFAETRFAGDPHDLSIARTGAPPAPHYQVDLLVAAKSGSSVTAREPKVTTREGVRW